MVKTFKIYTLSRFQVYSIVVLTVVVIFCFRSPELIHLAWLKLCTQHLPPPSPKPWQPQFYTASLSLTFLDFTYKRDCAIFVFLCLSYLIPHNIMSSRFIHIVSNDRILFFFKADVFSLKMCVCIHTKYSIAYIPRFLSLLIHHQLTHRLNSYVCYCESFLYFLHWFIKRTKYFQCQILKRQALGEIYISFFEMLMCDKSWIPTQKYLLLSYALRIRKFWTNEILALFHFSPS